VDPDHIGCKSWKLIARTIKLTPRGKSEETRGESLGKVVCRSTKAAISLNSETRKDRGKVTRPTYRNSSTLISLLFLKIVLCITHPKLQANTIRPISGAGKGTNFKFCTHSHGIDQNKSPLKMSGKVDVGVAVQGLPKIFRAPI